MIPGLKPALPLDLKPKPGTNALLRFDGARARARFVPQKAQGRARARKLESLKHNPNLETGDALIKMNSFMCGLQTLLMDKT